MSHTYKTDLQFPSAHQYQMDGTMGEVCSYSWRWNKKDKTITIEAMFKFSTPIPFCQFPGSPCKKPAACLPFSYRLTTPK